MQLAYATDDHWLESKHSILKVPIPPSAKYHAFCLVLNENFPITSPLHLLNT